MQRHYQLQLGPNCTHKCSSCSSLGQKSAQTKTHFDLERSLTKAHYSDYNNIIFPCNSLNYELLFKKNIERCEQLGLQKHFSIHAVQLNKHFNKIINYTSQLQSLIIFFDHPNQLLLEQLKQISTPLNFVIIPKGNIKQLKKTIIETFNKLKKEFSVNFNHQANQENYFTPKQIESLKRQLHNELPEYTLKGYDQVDIFDSRIVSDMDLEPVLKPQYSQKRKNSQSTLDFSVIIPSFNNKTELLNSLNYLTQQDYDKDLFEIIVIDDGSEDKTSIALHQWALDNPNINFCFFHFPRVIPRKPGDSRFRAGISRNLGAKFANGQIIAFLDADILTPPSYLKQLKADHEHSDVVQIRRHHLKYGVMPNEVIFENIEQMNKKIYHPDRGYWREFYNNPQKWDDRTAKWKYLCTYGLSLRAKTFKDIGWFRKVFLYYGFEDTDLGYRLAQKDYKFHLSKIISYHQFGEHKRNEHKHSDFKRIKLLSKTAKIFYHHYLSEDIFGELGIFLKSPRRFNPFARKN